MVQNQPKAQAMKAGGGTKEEENLKSEVRTLRGELGKVNQDLSRRSALLKAAQEETQKLKASSPPVNAVNAAVNKPPSAEEMDKVKKENKMLAAELGRMNGELGRVKRQLETSNRQGASPSPAAGSRGTSSGPSPSRGVASPSTGDGDKLQTELKSLRRELSSVQAENMKLKKDVRTASPPPKDSTPPAASPSSDAVVELLKAIPERLKLLHDVYTVFDIDRSGYIETKELMRLGNARRDLKHKKNPWTAEKNRRMIEKLDINGDGRVEEFEYMVHFEQALPRDEEEFGVVVAQFQEAADQFAAEHTEAEGSAKTHGEQMAELEALQANLVAEKAEVTALKAEVEALQAEKEALEAELAASGHGGDASASASTSEELASITKQNKALSAELGRSNQLIGTLQKKLARATAAALT